jgi:hypothetical protein
MGGVRISASLDMCANPSGDTGVSTNTQEMEEGVRRLSLWGFWRTSFARKQVGDMVSEWTSGWHTPVSYTPSILVAQDILQGVVAIAKHTVNQVQVLARRNSVCRIPVLVVWLRGTCSVSKAVSWPVDMWRA